MCHRRTNRPLNRQPAPSARASAGPETSAWPPQGLRRGVRGAGGGATDIGAGGARTQPALRVVASGGGKATTTAIGTRTPSTVATFTNRSGAAAARALEEAPLAVPTTPVPVRPPLTIVPP